MANPTVLRSIIALATTPAADHAVRPLVRVLLGRVVAFIARVHLLATAEPEPAIALGVMATAPAFRQLRAGREAQCFFLPPRSCGARYMFRRDAQEFRLRDLEAEFLVAFSADIARGVAAYRDDSWCWVGSGALGAGWYECAKEHVNWNTTFEV